MGGAGKLESSEVMSDDNRNFVGDKASVRTD